jgi:hypothetical protein
MIHGAAGDGRLYRIVAWILFAVFLFGFFMELLPRKGFDFGDEGYYLYSAWAASQEGIKLDTFIPQAPAYILNAVFMKIGIRDYLHLRIVYYAVIALSLFIFIQGVFSERKTPDLCPVIVALGFLGSMTTILSYSNAPVLLLLLSNGLFYLHLSTKHNIIKCLLALFSGAVIAVSGFVNMAILPAAILNVLVFYYIHRTENYKNVYLIGFILTVASLFYWYLSNIGLNELFRTTVAHSLQKTYLKAEATTLFLSRWFVLFGMVYALVYLFNKYRLSLRISAFCMGVLILPILTTFFVFVIIQYSFGIDWLNAANIAWLRNYNIDWGTGRWLTGWRLLMREAMGGLGLSLFSLALVTCHDATASYKRLRLTGIFVTLYCFAHLSTTATGLETSMIYYSGPMLAIAFLLFYGHYDQRPSTSGYGIWVPAILHGCLILIFGAGLIYQTNYSFNGSPSYAKKEKINVPALHGIRDVSHRKEMIENMYEMYWKNNCQSKPFIALSLTPLLYYVFSREAPGDGGHIHPSINWPEQEMFRILAEKAEWCVFWNSNYSDMEHDKVERLQSYLSDNSILIRRVGGHHEAYSSFYKEPYTEFIVYIK